MHKKKHASPAVTGAQPKQRLTVAREAPEIVFALVAPTGCDLDGVIDALATELGVVGYNVAATISLSKQICAIPPYESIARERFEDKRITRLQTAGDAIRRKLGDGCAVAALAVAEIIRQRKKAQLEGKRIAWILRSLKHPDEVTLLRDVYGSNLIVISVYESKEERLDELVRRIEKSRKASFDRVKATEIVDRDEHWKSGGKFGQDVRGVFPLADFFVRGRVNVQQQITRLVQALFSHPFRTPSREEFAMFLARATALRSADLSRQVGAVILNDRGEEVASGYNEVPKMGGGVYEEDDPNDCRDFQTGADPNAIVRRDIVEEIVSALSGRGVSKLDTNKLGRDLQGSRVASLVEFGRIVHAEMNAIVSASRRGVEIRGGTLYCTTFPCHVCARHILGAGIKEVVFIEPYPKSMALQLYSDSIVLDDKPRDSHLVFRPFIGVAPRRYIDFFTYVNRKADDGYAIKWRPRSSLPRWPTGSEEHALREGVLVGNLRRALQTVRWST